MAQKRRLTDLYVVGRELEFTDGKTDEEGNALPPIQVFMRKMNPVDHAAALKRANAARARAASLHKDSSTEEYRQQEDVIADFDDDSLKAYLTQEFRANKAAVVQAEVAADEEWAEDGYLEGIIDSWGDFLADKYAKDPTDAEALAAFNAMQRFDVQVRKTLDALVDDFADSLEHKSSTALRQDVLKKLFEMQESLAWLTEYRNSEVWLGTKCPDKITPYFESRDEVDLLPNEVMAVLLATYRELAVDPVEGKDSAVTATSSPSSEPLDEAEVA